MRFSESIVEDAARSWLGERDLAAERIWLGKLSEIRQNEVDAILAEIPPQRMSPVTRKFTLELLMINQRRLLESLSP